MNQESRNTGKRAEMSDCPEAKKIRVSLSCIPVFLIAFYG
jgi:hypothetical protein